MYKLYKMDIMKHSNRFKHYLEIVEDADPEVALELVLQEAYLSSNELKRLVLWADTSYITAMNFERVLDTLHSHAFDGFDEIVKTLNSHRDLTFPAIQNNIGLKEIIDQTCICRNDKCTIRTVLSRDHFMCLDYHYKRSTSQMRNEIDRFPYNGEIKYSIEMLKHLIDKKYISPSPDYILYNKLYSYGNLELVKFCIEKNYVDLKRSYNVYDKGLDWVQLFFEYDILDKEETFTTAVLRNHLESVKLFYENGFVQDHCSEIAFRRAALNGYDDILNFMFDKGIEYPIDVSDMINLNLLRDSTKNILCKRVDKKYFDGGREVDLSLPPVKVGFIVNSYDDIENGICRLADFVNDISSCDSIWVDYTPTKSWKELIGNHPLDSPAYAARFGIKCSTGQERRQYITMIIRLDEMFADGRFDDRKIEIRTHQGAVDILRQEVPFDPVTITVGKRGVTRVSSGMFFSIKSALQFLRNADKETIVTMLFEDEDDELVFKDSQAAIDWIIKTF